MGKTIKIFVASSEELKEERKMLAELANSLNSALEMMGIHVIMEEWENLDSSMGVKHKQEEYNDKLRECDMCIALFWTKLGKFTQMEFNTAVEEINAGKKLCKIYVYFKDSDHITPELKEFQDSFESAYSHFCGRFSNSDMLKADFLLQFMICQSDKLQSLKIAEVKDGHVYVDGTEYVDLKYLPFAGNNEEYNSLVNDIKELELDLADMNPSSERYLQKIQIYQQKKEKLAQMESSLWDTALLITKLCTSKCSERLQRAMNLFYCGDNKGALAILNENEIDKDVDYNKRLIKLGEEGKNGLLSCIEQYCLRIKTLKNDISESPQKVIELYKKTIELARGIMSDDCFMDLLSEFIFYASHSYFYEDAILYCTEYSECVRKKTLNKDNQNCLYVRTLREIALIHNQLGFFSLAEKEINEVRAIINTWNPVNKMEEILCLNDSFNVFSSHNKWEIAERNLSDAYKTAKVFYSQFKTNGVLNVYLKVILNQTNLLIEQNQFEEALKLNQEGETILLDYGAKGLVANDRLNTIYNNYSRIYKRQGQYDMALQASIKAVAIGKEIYKEAPSQYIESLACSLLNLGASYLDICNYKLSLVHTNEAIVLYEKLNLLNKNIAMNRFASNLAMLYYNRCSIQYNLNGLSQEAMCDLDMSLSLYRDLIHHSGKFYYPQLGECLKKHAAFLILLGNIDKAYEDLSESLEIFRDYAQKYPAIYEVEYADSLMEIANLRIHSSDEAQKGVIECKQSIELLDKHNINGIQDVKLARCYQILGKLYYGCLGMFDESIIALQKSIELYKCSDVSELGAVYDTVATAYAYYDKIDEAELWYQKTLDYYEAKPESACYVMTLRNYAIILYRNNKTDIALENIKKALRINEKIEEMTGTQTNGHNLLLKTLAVIEKSQKGCV